LATFFFDFETQSEKNEFMFHAARGVMVPLVRHLPRKKANAFMSNSNGFWLIFLLNVGMWLPVTGQGVDQRGRLYGEIRTKTGNGYTGVLRWGKEEASWDDLFHSTKTELPHKKFAKEKSQETQTLRVFGLKIATSRKDLSRVFVARFGDMVRIIPGESNRATVEMKSGLVMEVQGYSNDVNATITVEDPLVGTFSLEWEQIAEIRFLSVPERTIGPGRIFGLVEGRGLAVEGFVQWDHDEALLTDRLDGETVDGKASIPFSGIERIEKLSSRAAKVTLLDGRTLRLDESNDVDEGNRGIYVETETMGRLDFSWNSFERLTLKSVEHTGRPYDAYTNQPLQGTVHLTNGKELSGALVYDLDESETWEMLDGRNAGIGYSVPFSLIQRLDLTNEGVLVHFLDGKTVELSGEVDVGEKNLGVLVFSSHADDPEHVQWREIQAISFQKPF
jgi:hypothetical protein